MSYYGSRGNLYRALAAEAIEKDGKKQMIDFKAMAARKKADMEEKKKNLTPLPIPGKMVEAKRNIREQTLDDLEELIHSNETSIWEKNFCKSVKSWLLKDPANYMSFKQEAVYDKLVRGILLTRDTTSPVPTRDNSKIPYKKYEDRSVPKDLDDPTFDPDMDIPF